MLSPNIDDDDIDLKSLEYLIKEAQKQLEEDKLKEQRNMEMEITKKRRSDGNHNQPIETVALSEDKLNNRLLENAYAINQVKEKHPSKDKTNVFMIRNPREEEINKLIETISKPKENVTFKRNTEFRRSFPQTRSCNAHVLNPVNIREKEKDKLSEKLASSEYPLTKPSSRQVAKNLNSSITFNDHKQNNCMKTINNDEAIKKIHKLYSNASETKTIADDVEDYLSVKYNHPKILISQHQESNKTEDVANLEDIKMVRIGEFSPLNPNVPGGATVLGLGEWDKKRQFLLEKYRQVSRSPSPSSCERDQNHNLRSIATQTDLSDDWSPNITSERSPQYESHTSKQSPCHEQGRDNDKLCTSPQSKLSPIPKCYENMTEKEIKEFIYRQELERQIKEKNRQKEELKKREAEEEARIEAKIQKDLEKMRRQYEEERLQRLEIAIRKREQEDFLRQRLAIDQEKVMPDGKTVKKRPLKDPVAQDHSHKQFEKNTQSDFERSVKAVTTQMPYSRSLPERSAASTLSRVHKELQQPLLQPLNDVTTPEGFGSYLSEGQTEHNLSLQSIKTKQVSTNTSIPPSVSMHRTKEMDILAQRAVFDTNSKISPRMNSGPTNPSDTIKDKLKEVDNILKQPLLPESQRALPPVSQPLIYATIPPLSASLQTPRDTSPGAASKMNGGSLEDKWKVPCVGEDRGEAPNTKHNARILTQLGTFRRQLQQESLRMRQRVREDSP